FDLRHPVIGRFLASWWNELEKHTSRDQLSINYALRLHRLSWRPLVAPPHSMRSHPDFALLPHGGETRPIAERRIRSVGGTDVARARAPVAVREAKPPRMLAHRNRTIDVVVCVKDALEDVRLCLE